jgi:site-specific DNA-cytosine methylase
MGLRVHDDGTTRSLKSDIGGTGVPVVIQRGPDKSFHNGDDGCVNALGIGSGHFANSSSPVVSNIPVVVQNSGDIGARKLSVSDMAYTLRVSSNSDGGQHLMQGRRFRRLTPIECERLQGWPDDHTAIGLYRTSTLPKSQRSHDEYTYRPVSDTQRYRMTGNGVTADVVREVVLKMMIVGCL